MKQHITLLLAAVGILTLAGCVQEDYEPIFVTPSDSESFEEVTEDELVDSEETEETVSSEDTNVEETSDEVSEVDTDLSSEALAQEGWVTYTNDEYGFSFEYPSKMEINKVSNQEIYFETDSDYAYGVKLLIEDYSHAENGAENLHGLMKSPAELEALKVDISENPDIVVNDIPVRVGFNYSVEGANFYKEYDFFSGSDRVWILTTVETSDLESALEHDIEERSDWIHQVLSDLDSGLYIERDESNRLKEIHKIIESVLLI